LREQRFEKLQPGDAKATSVRRPQQRRDGRKQWFEDVGELEWSGSGAF
jgi:hypothetical protein